MDTTFNSIHDQEHILDYFNYGEMVNCVYQIEPKVEKVQLCTAEDGWVVTYTISPYMLCLCFRYN